MRVELLKFTSIIREFRSFFTFKMVYYTKPESLTCTFQMDRDQRVVQLFPHQGLKKSDAELNTHF